MLHPFHWQVILISDSYTNIAGASTNEIALATIVASTGDPTNETEAIQQLIAYRTSDGSDDGILGQSSSSSPADSRPTGADAIITPNEDAPHVITKANFGYQDSNGDAFTSVKISSLPAAGTLKLDGTAVQQNVPISVTDIDANKLTFEAAANASGDNYASIGFVVMNAKGEDSTPNTLTVNVQPVDQMQQLV